MIELIQLVIESYRHQATDLVHSRSSPSFSPSIGGADERERVKSDDILDRSERKKAHATGAASPIPVLLQTSSLSFDEDNRLKPLVDVIKAGLNCITRHDYILS